MEVPRARSGAVNRVVHDGRETAYRLARPGGTGPTALYVHGAGATHRVWGRQYGPAGPTHPAAALDLSGHGASEDGRTGAGKETLGAYLADVRAVARETDAEVLVGHSLGGAVVLRALAAGIDGVRSAVVTGCGARFEIPDRLLALLESSFDRAVERLHERMAHDSDPAVLNRSAATMQSVGRAVTERDFRTCRAVDLRGTLADVDVPVWVVAGEHDEVVPPADQRRLVRALPDGRLTTVDPGHLTPIERPAAFAEAVTTATAPGEPERRRAGEPDQ